MALDILATERHFVDHLAPVWRALPSRSRGAVLVRHDLVGHAAALGLPAQGVDHRDVPSGGPTLVASIGDLRKARRARRPVALLEHGYGQSYGGHPASARHPSYPGGRDRDAELFLSPNEHAAGRDREAYPDARVEVIGSPKLDALPARVGRPGAVVAISSHFDSPVCQETRSGFVRFRPAFAELARRFEVIGHGHPRLIDQVGRWYARMGIEVVRDFREVCRRADVYACDNSSTLYEFASTGRPVVVLDPPFYRRHVHHGLRFWEAAPVGVHSGPEIGAVVAAVEQALALSSGDVAQRESALDIVYAYRSGAAERASAVLRDWMRERSRAQRAAA